MTADALRLALLGAGLHVVEEPGWRTRGNLWNINAKPEGVMQHHTAPPNPYPISKLYGPPFYRTKCNMATHEDGTLYLVAYKACNYSSGYGMRSVLTDNVRPSIAPTHNARKRGLKSGNRHFWNYENSHPGDGSAIPQVQLDTIIESTRVVLDHFELDPEQVISHAEWTSRKIDPRWNGSNRTAIEQIREAVKGDDDMQPPSWATAATQWHIDRDIYSQNAISDVDEDIEFHRQTVFRHRFYNSIKGEFGESGTDAKITTHAANPDAHHA